MAYNNPKRAKPPEPPQQTYNGITTGTAKIACKLCDGTFTSNVRSNETLRTKDLFFVCMRCARELIRGRSAADLKHLIDNPGKKPRAVDVRVGTSGTMAISGASTYYPDATDTAYDGATVHRGSVMYDYEGNLREKSENKEEDDFDMEW